MLGGKQNVKTMSRPSARPADRRRAYLEFRNVDRAVEVALYYGFTPLPAPLVVNKEDREKARSIGAEREAAALPLIEEKAALFRYYLDKKLCDAPQPFLLASEVAALDKAKKVEQKTLFLDILGSDKAIAEAILIQTCWATMHEEGAKDMTLRVNSVGDRDSFSRFVRELVNYYRKNISALPAPCRAALRINPFELLECPHEKCRLLSTEAPKSIGFLSEASRAHFKEVLEYLEELGLPFTIDNQLIGNRHLASETVFALVGADGAETLSLGMRYSIARRLGSKHDVPSVGAALFLKRTKAGNARVRIKRPSFLFLQLGNDAKLKSLSVIEALRLSGIPLYQFVARDKLIAQLSAAEHLKIPYSIIMGQKEALEQSVNVRNNTTRSQETVKIADLPSYLKKLKTQ